MTEERKLQWKKLEEEVNAMGGSGAEFVDAMQDFYSIYSDRVIEWYAGLYDYKGGGFYFSTSGRDHDGYLPDIEATLHSLGFFEKFEGVSNYKDPVPEWMRVQTGKWVKGLQDPNGYFYHPQWTREMIDGRLNRKGRDLNYGLGVMYSLGFTPTYDTPLGHKGDGLLPDGTPAPACAACTPVSDGVEAKPASTVVFPEHLESVANFKKYLENNQETLETKPYVMGNMIANQISQIKARDRMLREAGETESLCELLIEWFNRRQNPETGHWYHFNGDPSNARLNAYEGNNALLKIMDVYNQCGAEVAHPLKAARSAMQAIASTVYPATVCDMYNTWFAVNMVVMNIAKYSTRTEAEKRELITTIRRELIREAPAYIREMKPKMIRFRRADHAFSYLVGGTSIMSQGMPVALKGYDEGDTNASCIVIGGCNAHIYDALGLNRVKPYENALLKEYLALLEENHRKFG